MNMDRLIREEARLILLKALQKQIDERLSSELLRMELASYGLSRTRPWVHEELGYLAEMGAVTLVDAGSVRIATLTEKGGRHLNREIVIEGVKRPSRPEA